MGREHDERRAVLESMGGAHGEERCSYRPQQHGCGVNGGIWGEAGRSILLLLLEASSPVACPNKLALVTFQQAGRPPVGSLSLKRRQLGPDLTFHKPKEEDRQLIGRLSRINRRLRTTPPPQQHTHINSQPCRPQTGNARSTKPTQKPSTQFRSISIPARNTSPASTSAKCSAQNMDESWRKERRRKLWCRREKRCAYILMEVSASANDILT